MLPVNITQKENDKLTWEETFIEMAEEDEDWSDLENAIGDGIE